MAQSLRIPRDAPSAAQQTRLQTTLFEYRQEAEFPRLAQRYPEFRYMGSKHRLLPWLHSILGGLSFESARDPFSGSGAVAYLLKAMGKAVHASDFLNFPAVIGRALVENSSEILSPEEIELLVSPGLPTKRFIAETFGGIFFEQDDLLFLDLVWERLPELATRKAEELALTALIRSCMKK